MDGTNPLVWNEKTHGKTLLDIGVLFSSASCCWRRAMAIAVTLLNRIDYAVFAVVYFLTEVPLLLGTVAVYRRWRLPAVQQAEIPEKLPVTE